MNDQEAEAFLANLAVTYRSPYADERTGWLEWLLTGYVKLESATRTLEQINSKGLPQLPAFKALYNEIIHSMGTAAYRNREFPPCALCADKGTQNYVIGGFSAGQTRPIKDGQPRNFPYMTSSQLTYCLCEKGKAQFFIAHPGGNWGNHVAFVDAVASGATPSVTDDFIRQCREQPPEDWENWKDVFKEPPRQPEIEL